MLIALLNVTLQAQNSEFNPEIVTLSSRLHTQNGPLSIILPDFFSAVLCLQTLLPHAADMTKEDVCVNLKSKESLVNQAYRNRSDFADLK